jgi:universal stress protein A
MKTPFQTVLCPTDLSAAGDAAVDLAYALAARSGTVHLLHVCEPAMLMSPLDATPIVTLPSTAEGQDKVEANARKHMKALVPEDSLSRGVKTEFHVVHEPEAASVIEAKRLGADVIVLGTHGRTGLAKALLGSVASAVMKRAKRPVVLARVPAV